MQAEVLAQADADFQRQGAVLLPQVLARDLLDPWRRHAQAAYAQADVQYRQGQMAPDYLQGLYRYGHLSPEDSQPAQGLTPAQLIAPLRPLLARLLGPELYLLGRNTLLRRQQPSGVAPPLPFHQDALFLGVEAPILNIWVPLHACGLDSPGLEVVTVPVQQVFFPPGLSPEALQAGPSYAALALPEQALRTSFTPEQFCHLPLEVGDVWVFSQWTLHRTWLTPAMQGSRHSLEIRVTGIRQRSLQTPLLPL